MKRLFLTIGLLVLSVPGFAATCKISEYEALTGDDQGNIVPVAREPALAEQSVTYSTDATSNAFNDDTRFVRIVCDAKAHFKFGTGTPNPDANSPYLAADTPEYFGIWPVGGSIKVTFYDGSS